MWTIKTCIYIYYFLLSFPLFYVRTLNHNKSSTPLLLSLVYSMVLFIIYALKDHYQFGLVLKNNRETDTQLASLFSLLIHLD